MKKQLDSDFLMLLVIAAIIVYVLMLAISVEIR